MKKKGSKCDYIEERNRNLKREFLARLGKNGKCITQVIADLTLAPADRFYISEERAVRAVRSMRGEGAVRVAVGVRGVEGAGGVRVNPRKRAMMGEIMRRVEGLMVRNPDLDLRDAVYEVVNSPAQAFYLTMGSIRTILYEEMKMQC